MTMRMPSAGTEFAVNRRAFLQVGAAGLLGLTLADVLRAEAGREGSTRKRATGVILVFLDGGPSHIDMWDLKPEAPLEIRGEFRPVATSVPGLQVCAHLPKLAKVMDRVTVIRSLHHVINDHSAGSRYVLAGRLPSPSADPPALGALAAALLQPGFGMPAAVTLKTGANSNIEGKAGPGGLGAVYSPLQIGLSGGTGGSRPAGFSLPDALSVAELENRERLRRELDRSFARLDRTEMPARLDRFQQQALDILRSDKVRRALDVDTEPLSVRRAYGITGEGYRLSGDEPALARALLTARRLIEAGARFVTVGAQADLVWDTHKYAFESLRSALLPTLDRGLPALIADLDARRLLDKTVVYCVGEFGRTPKINTAAGRDHWPQAMAALVAGGGFRRGHVYGATDRNGTAPTRDPCTPADMAATIFDRLGFPPAHRPKTLRDTAIFPEGRVLSGLTGA
jgi:hypothetical protein